MQEFWKRQQEELNADLRAWTDSFSDRLSQLPVTVPYLRSSDGAFVVSFFCSVSPDWMLAADISLEDLSEFFAPRQRKDRFFFLIDSRSRRLLTCPDTSLCGLTVAETEEPLLAPFLSAKELPQTALPVKNRHGTILYHCLCKRPLLDTRHLLDVSLLSDGRFSVPGNTFPLP